MCDEYPDENVIINTLYLYAGFIVGTGIIGNIINVVVFSSKTMRKHSSNAYIIVLAVSDSIYLVDAFIHLLTTLKCIYSQHKNVDIINKSDAFCKLVHFSIVLSANFSSMIILCFTLKRLIAVYVWDQ